MRLHKLLERVSNMILLRLVSPRLISRFFGARAHPSPRQPNTIEAVSFTQSHTQAQSDAWEKLVKMPFDPLESLAMSEGRNVRCPLSKGNVFTRESSGPSLSVLT